ncbi:MAG: hypothetical protein AAGF92_06160 [Myxococcota bacterium]
MSTCPQEPNASMMLWSGTALDDALYDLEDEPSAPSGRRPGLPLEPRRIFRILAAERSILLRAFLGVAALALVASFFVPKTYRSGATLLYEGSPVLDDAGSEGDPRPFVQSTMSSTQLGKVRERLAWPVSLNALRTRLEIGIEDRNAMRVSGSGATPEEAQALTQTVIDVFLERQLVYNAKRLETLKLETERAIARAVERRREAAGRYEAFREQSGKTHLLDDQDRLLARLAELRTSADQAAVEVAANEARIAELEKARRELPRQVVASATVGKSVDAPLATARAELASARATLSSEHPRVQALKERVRSLEKQRRGAPTERGDQTMISNPARDAVEQDLATTRAALAAAQERETALRVLIDSVKAEADALAPAEGEARDLATGLKVADARLEDLRERATDIQDALVAPSTGFRILSPPPLPEEATRSGKTITILWALPILVTLLLALTLIVRELRSLVLESPRELAWWGQGPVLGTSPWPRDEHALETFVDELEDYGVHGAGRTLVVPASEAEREIAVAFAMRLSEAPWLAAAILDVEERSASMPAAPIITPPSGGDAPLIPPNPEAPPRRLSSGNLSASPSSASPRPPTKRPPARPTIQGFAPPDPTSEPPDETPRDDTADGPADKWSSAPPPTASTPLPPKLGGKSVSSRPPRKKTILGLPAVKGGRLTPAAASGESAAPRSVRGVARATVRMVVQASQSEPASNESKDADRNEQEEAFLLKRPVTVSGGNTSPPGPPDSPADAPASHAVMRAAMKLLGETDEDTQTLRRSSPPSAGQATGGPSGVALGWNGPLSGPVLRRAARLAHRVLVVVSSGMNVLELRRVTTRLGREEGVGYVLVNLPDAYLDLPDRVGDVETFWAGPQRGDGRSQWPS